MTGWRAMFARVFRRRPAASPPQPPPRLYRSQNHEPHLPYVNSVRDCVARKRIDRGPTPQPLVRSLP